MHTEQPTDQEPREQESRASLLVYTETRSAEELRDAIGAEPDHLWNKGDPNKRGRPYPTTAIVFESASANASPDEQLCALLARIEPLQERLRAAAAHGDVVRLKLAVFDDADNITFTIAPDAVAELAALGLPLELDIYSV